VGGSKEKREKRGRGYKRRDKMKPVNYVGDRNTQETRVLSLLRVNTDGSMRPVGRMLDRKEEKKM